MGMEQSVTLVNEAPAWPTVRDLLASVNYPVQMRMIEGQLAFPDEEPPAEWREIRLGTPSGMITVRREPQRLTFVVWGNADAAMLRDRNALMWAFAEAGNGMIDGADAATFRQTADLPDEV